MAGWIKLYRDIQDHWIWADAQKFKWWIDIIFMCNIKDKKMVSGNDLIVIKRGSFHTSELKLAERWGVSKKSVRSFLDLLEKDNMVELSKSKKGTTIEVVKYLEYQDVLVPSDTVEEPQKNHRRTIKELQKNHIGTIKKPFKNHKGYTTKEIKKDKEGEERKESKESSFVKNPLIAIFENEFGLLNPNILENISYYYEQGVEIYLVHKAIDIAKSASKKNIGYVCGILNNWLENGIKSLGEFERRIKDGNSEGSSGQIEYTPAELYQLNHKPGKEDKNLPF